MTSWSPTSVESGTRTPRWLEVEPGFCRRWGQFWYSNMRCARKIMWCWLGARIQSRWCLEMFRGSLYSHLQAISDPFIYAWLWVCSGMFNGEQPELGWTKCQKCKNLSGPLNDNTIEQCWLWTNQLGNVGGSHLLVDRDVGSLWMVLWLSQWGALIWDQPSSRLLLKTMLRSIL